MLTARLVRQLCILSVSACVFGSTAAHMIQGPATALPVVQNKRPVTVGDAIRMTRLADPGYSAGAPSKGIVAKFSPNGQWFVVILRKGNLETNTNQYTLILFRTSDVLHLPAPRTLVKLDSSSNEEAIKNVSWLDDNETIIFMGSIGIDNKVQLYSVCRSSGEVKKLTNHSTNLSSYAITPNGRTIVFAAESQVEEIMTETALRHGIHVSTQLLSDLIAGKSGGEKYDDHELFAQVSGINGPVQLKKLGRITTPFIDLSLSSDGKYVVVATMATDVPEIWREYKDRFLQLRTNRRFPGVSTGVFQYELIDTHTGVSRLLLDAPLGFLGFEAVWSPDSKSVVVAGVHLPLNVADTAVQKARQEGTFLAEVKIPDLRILEIAKRDLKIVRWDPKTHEVLCEVGRLDSLTGKPTQKIVYARRGSGWEEVQSPVYHATSPEPEIELQEDMNTPPRIVALNRRTGEKSLVFDLNPQFEDLDFGRVQEVRWKDSNGDEIRGGLYFPPNYVAGTRYPVVIQTHGFSPDRFWIDGPWATSFAAQPLANKGFLVLQASDPEFNLQETPEEARRAMAAYEGSIDYLDSRGLIDRARVGIIGFSRTCLYVTYTLTHSKYRLAAATITDGVDGGYFQYMAFSNAYPVIATDAEAVNGGVPFGEGLSAWMKSSPAFNLDKVRTPVLIQALGPISLLTEWEWFSGLSRLDKPVDLIYIPDGTHILERPWDRMISQQTEVDWFAFWLKGNEDPDPTKREQYNKWHTLLEIERDVQKKAMPH